jgi:hypothetical protein
MLANMAGTLPLNCRDAGCEGARPYWAMCHNGTVIHLVGGQVAPHLTLFFARCKPHNSDDGYILDTFPTIRGIRAMQEMGLVCRKCKAIHEGRMP